MILLNFIIKHGRLKSVVVITISAVAASVIATNAIFFFMGKDIPRINQILSVSIPAVIASLWSWRTVGMIHKIHNLEQEVRRLVDIDTLTAVMSRYAFLSQAESICRLMVRNNKPFAVLYFDLDDFKKINDAYGHAGDDVVLVDFGRILKGHIRKSDLVGRLGGEEFAALLPETESKGAVYVAKKIINSVNKSVVNFSDKTISYSVSIGISVRSENNPIGIDELISQADKALYSAKKTGKNKLVLFS